MKRMVFVGWIVLLALPGCREEVAGPDGSGTIECTQVDVSPKVPGFILTAPPKEGALVKKGEQVTQIDPADYTLKLNEAKGALAYAKAQRDLMVKGSREEDIQRAREQVREAEAAARAADADLKRIQEVYDKKSATQKQMDDVRAGADRSKATLAAAEQTLAKLSTGNRLEEIQMAEAQVAQVQARVAQAEKAVADCTVVSPMEGSVTTRSREEGEFVNVGAPILTLSRLDEVWLSIYVPEPKLGRVNLGQKAIVRVDGRSERFTGSVTYISPEAEFTPRNVQTADERAKLVYRVKITLPNPDGVFKPGMPADGYLEGVS